MSEYLLPIEQFFGCTEHSYMVIEFSFDGNYGLKGFKRVDSYITEIRPPSWIPTRLYNPTYKAWGTSFAKHPLELMYGWTSDDQEYRRAFIAGIEKALADGLITQKEIELAKQAEEEGYRYESD